MYVIVIPSNSDHVCVVRFRIIRENSVQSTIESMQSSISESLPYLPVVFLKPASDHDTIRQE